MALRNSLGQSRKEPPPGADSKRIAIFRFGYIGDTIVALPALRVVRSLYPEAKIYYMTKETSRAKIEPGTEVLHQGTLYDDVIYYRGGRNFFTSSIERVRSLRDLKAKRIDTLIYLPSFRTPAQIKRDKIFFRAAGIKNIIGLKGYKTADYHPKGKPLPMVPKESQVLLRHLQLDGVASEDPSLIRFDLDLSDREREEAVAWLNGQTGLMADAEVVIGIAPGSKMSSKRWPISRFEEVVRCLDQRYRANFVVFGSAREAELCKQIASVPRHGVNAAGDLSVRGSAAVFEHVDMYIGNDTGTMHIAASAGVPCVAIFSARDWPGRWYPHGTGHRILRSIVDCEGCMLEECNNQNLCLTQISTEAVLAEAEEVLSSLIQKVPK